MSKFLLGILLVQALTTVLILLAVYNAADMQLLIVIGLAVLIVALLAGFWFSYLARDIHQDSQVRLRIQHAQDRENILLAAEKDKANIEEQKSVLKEQLAQERERILLQAERDKAQFAEASYRYLEKEIKKAQAKANFKVGFAFATAAGIGGIMLLSQLITLGLVVLVASGSGLAGYLLRARQDRLARQQKLLQYELDQH